LQSQAPYFSQVAKVCSGPGLALKVEVQVLSADIVTPPSFEQSPPKPPAVEQASGFFASYTDVPLS
jgi:hypothetical protein